MQTYGFILLTKSFDNAAYYYIFVLDGWWSSSWVQTAWSFLHTIQRKLKVNQTEVLKSTRWRTHLEKVNITKRTKQSKTNGVTLNSIQIKNEPRNFEQKETGDGDRSKLSLLKKHVKQQQTTSNQLTMCSPISWSPLVLLTRLSKVRRVSLSKHVTVNN